MVQLQRDPVGFAQESYDLVVVGGGIYGACMLLEASRRGWKTLLLERDDFGGATSLNSLRIIHGGLRYLQTLDLQRFHRSVREQAWWLQRFPDLIEPLPCLMPLYNRGLKRKSVMRAALYLNDLLAKPSRTEVLEECDFPASNIFDVPTTKRKFPLVRASGLVGAASWCDALLSSPQRLLMELLRWSASVGGRSLNYLRCTDFQVRKNEIHAVLGECQISGRSFEFRTNYVVNCAGPWCQHVLHSVGENRVANYGAHAVACNIVIDRAPLSDSGVAITPDRKQAATYFAVPYRGRVSVGTLHLPPQEEVELHSARIAEFIDELNCAVPGWDLSTKDVMKVWPGRLPAIANGSHIPAKKPKIYHGDPDGVVNLTTVQGPKYTTARHVAEVVLKQIAKRSGKSWLGYVSSTRPSAYSPPELGSVATNVMELAHDLRTWISNESVMHVDDLVCRRCDLSEPQKQVVGRWLVENCEWPTSKEHQLQRLRTATVR